MHIKYALISAILITSIGANGQNICDEDQFKDLDFYKEGLIWKEDKLNEELALGNLEYLKQEIETDITKTHYLSVWYAFSAIEGFYLKELAKKELLRSGSSNNYAVTVFCNWLAENPIPD